MLMLMMLMMFMMMLMMLIRLFSVDPMGFYCFLISVNPMGFYCFLGDMDTKLVHPRTDILCLRSLELFHFSATVGNQLEEVRPLRHKCYPEKAIHIACLAVPHRICKLLPPKGSVDLPVLESDRQVRNWSVDSVTPTHVGSRNRLDAYD